MKYKNAKFAGKKPYVNQIKWQNKRTAGYDWQNRDDELEFSQTTIKKNKGSIRKTLMRKHLYDYNKIINKIITLLTCYKTDDYNIPVKKFELLECDIGHYYEWRTIANEFRLEKNKHRKYEVWVRTRKNIAHSYETLGRYSTYGAFGNYQSYYNNDDDYGEFFYNYDSYTKLSNLYKLTKAYNQLSRLLKYDITNEPMSEFDELIQ